MNTNTQTEITVEIDALEQLHAEMVNREAANGYIPTGSRMLVLWIAASAILKRDQYKSMEKTISKAACTAALRYIAAIHYDDIVSLVDHYVA